jgi:hypothetical protein
MEEHLFFKIIHRALLDIQGYLTRRSIFAVHPSEAAAVFIDAIKFIFSEECELYCKFAGLNYFWIRKMTKKLLRRKYYETRCN